MNSFYQNKFLGAEQALVPILKRHWLVNHEKILLQNFQSHVKEAKETKYWLRLLAKSQLVSFNYTEYLQDVESLINILTKIIKTSRENSGSV